MELGAFPAVSNFPVFCNSFNGNPELRFKQPLLLRKPLASRSYRHLTSRFRHFSVSLLRATASDDANGSGPYATEARDSVVTLEDSPSAEKNVYNEVVTSESSKEEPVAGGPEQTFELWNELKLESGDAYSIILYGSGALLGLWLVAAIIGAVDSIPLFPKFLEVVGLGFTVWFTTRYLIFKESRDELVDKIEEVKKQVLGLDGE